MSERAELDRAFDTICAVSTRDAARVRAARGVWDERRGQVHQDEPLWEAWSAAFVESYCLDTATHRYDAVQRTEHELDAAAVCALANSQRSLFCIEDVTIGRVVVRDIVGGGRFAVTEHRTLVGVAPGDAAELRLFGYRDAVWFGRTFIYYPREAVRFGEQLFASGLARNDVLDRVAATLVKSLRYRHVAPQKLYALGTR